MEFTKYERCGDLPLYWPEWSEQYYLRDLFIKYPDGSYKQIYPEYWEEENSIGVSCPNCGKLLTNSQIKYNATFCTKGCSISFREKEWVKNGTHPWQSGNFDHVQHNKDMVEQGIHPFLSQNFSEKIREENGIKHSKYMSDLARSGNHPWQQLSSRIENEYSIEINRGRYSNSDIVSLYISEFNEDNLKEYFKIGITKMDDIDRENNGLYSHELTNLTIIVSGNYKDIIKLEYDIKVQFVKEETYKNTKCTEAIERKYFNDVVDFIEKHKESSTTIQEWSKPKWAEVVSS